MQILAVLLIVVGVSTFPIPAAAGWHITLTEIQSRTEPLVLEVPNKMYRLPVKPAGWRCMLNDEIKMERVFICFKGGASFAVHVPRAAPISVDLVGKEIWTAKIAAQ